MSITLQNRDLEITRNDSERKKQWSDEGKRGVIEQERRYKKAKGMGEQVRVRGSNTVSIYSTHTHT